MAEIRENKKEDRNEGITSKRFEVFLLMALSVALAVLTVALMQLIVICCLIKLWG